MNLQCKHMLSPSRLWLKTNLGTCQKWWGEIWKSNQLCRQLTLEHDTLCFISGWDILLFIIDLPGLGHSFFPSICSLPHHHDHQSYGSKSCQNSSHVTNMFTSCPSVVTLTFDSLYSPKSFCIFWSCVDDVGNIMALLWYNRFPLTSTHYPGSWPRDSLLVP